MGLSPTAVSRIDQIFHDLFYVGITAASIFVKNPQSQQMASSIISLLGNTLLPLADTLLTPPAAAAAQVPLPMEQTQAAAA